ncbi:hypothetical protein SAMN02745248_01742 [Hathewaya proteolytica DSM 3090]|uniref:Uncharacterized protein n=1 Tax=Hathewaya proteolytica DSM 3090 TaxID=1121331 RepID=A0A1M6PKW4_9CLOT|nr:hypothetical protein [Hathewaya proteolytica]SHK08584.1 hypothetical protein SAMN02745248_01742 [Hathewaya proteolytica DSM 3090]
MSGKEQARDSEVENNVIKKEEIKDIDLNQLVDLNVKGADGDNIDALKQVMVSSGDTVFSKDDIEKLIVQVKQNVAAIDEASENVDEGMNSVTPDTFEKAGIVGVTDENMIFVLQKLNEMKSNSEVASLARFGESVARLGNKSNIENTSNLGNVGNESHMVNNAVLGGMLAVKANKHVFTAKEIQKIVNEVNKILNIIKKKINVVKDTYELPSDVENSELAMVNAVKAEIIKAINDETVTNNMEIVIEKELTKYKVTLKINVIKVVKHNVKISIKQPSLENATFAAELSKTEYDLNESVVISGKLLRSVENEGGVSKQVGVSKHDITITVFSADGQSLITLDQVETDDKGQFQYSFKVGKDVEAGDYKVVVSAKDISNGVKTLSFNFAEAKKDVKVEFNYAEYTAAVKGYIPSKGDLIITTTGITDAEIASVKITAEDPTVISVTQRPDHPDSGFTKSKVRAFGKALKVGTTRIIARVTDTAGNVYTAYCKITVTK